MNVWKWMKIVGEKHTPTQPTHPSPQQEAKRLATNFSARTSENLPPQIQRLQEKLVSARWREIDQACLQEDEAGIPYTLEELKGTYKKVKDTAPGSDRITYTMIRNLGVAGENLLLQLINKTHLDHCRPVTWSKQDTQPIPKPKEPINLRLITFNSCLGKTDRKNGSGKTQIQSRTSPPTSACLPRRNRHCRMHYRCPKLHQ